MAPFTNEEEDSERDTDSDSSLLESTLPISERTKQEINKVIFDLIEFTSGQADGSPESIVQEAIKALEKIQARLSSGQARASSDSILRKIARLAGGQK